MSIGAHLENQAPRIRRLCISLDLERYSRWNANEQREAQDGLGEVLDTTCRDAGLDRSTWSRQPAGDGELAVLPPGIDEGRAISEFVRSLGNALYKHNRRLSDDVALRLRVAMHAGMTQVAGFGFAGQAPVLAARLRDCAQARQSLADQRQSRFALVISQQLYEDHVGHEYQDFNTGSFRRIRVEIPAKEFAADAWIYAPGGTPVVEPSAAENWPPSGAVPVENGRSGGVDISGGQVDAHDIVGRDNHGPRP